MLNSDPPTQKQLDYMEVLIAKCINSSYYIRFYNQWCSLTTKEAASKLIDEMKKELEDA